MQDTKSRDFSSRRGWDPPKPSPIEFEKAEGIKFSGEPQDFTNFKRDFNKIIVPNQEISEVSFCLKQSIPKQHLF